MRGEAELRRRIEMTLNAIIDPCSEAAGAPVGLVDMGLVRDVELTVTDDGVAAHVVIGVTEIGCIMAAPFLHDAQRRLDELEDLATVEVVQDQAFDWVPEDMAPAYREHLAHRRSWLLPRAVPTTRGQR